MIKAHNNTYASSQVQQGFTLIELMIVVVFASILAAVAYPSYTKYTIKAKRTAAEGFMLQLASREEQYLADARTYTSAFTTSGNSLYITPPTETSGKYGFSIVVVTVNTDANYIAGAALPQYIITAIPAGAQATGDTQCGTLTLDSLGTKGKSGSGSLSDCWS